MSVMLKKQKKEEKWKHKLMKYLLKQKKG